MSLDSLCYYFFFQAEDGIRDYKVTGVQTCAFFFQAEDGIRDYKVTGVQTCALPIYAVTLGVAPQRVERVESHRLVVEERTVILGRVIMPEPRRLVSEQPERRGVRLGETELAEGDHLREHPLGGRDGDAACRRPVAGLLPESRHQPPAAPAAPWAPQRLRLARREPRERLAHLQHLVLIEDHAERLRETLFEQRVVQRRLVAAAGGFRPAPAPPGPPRWG